MAADPLTSRTVDSLMLNDDAFDFDDDPFADPQSTTTKRDDKAVLSPRKRKLDENQFGNNLDEEVKITKQRKKIPKLDAERLLSEPGIPHVRKLMRSGQLKRKLRLKGKGHELDDVARLLNFYQNWLDSLYPRAKFTDALQLVEKAGHTKKMQMYRKSWMDEGKPGHARKEDLEKAVAEHEQHNDNVPPSTTPPAVDQTKTVIEEPEDPSSMFFDDQVEVTVAADGPDDDELDALLVEGQQEHNNHQPSRPRTDDDSERGGDLGALLQEESPRRHRRGTLNETAKDESVPGTDDENDDDDDLDALLSTHSRSNDALASSKLRMTRLAWEKHKDQLDGALTKYDGVVSKESNLLIQQHSPARSLMANDIILGSEEVPELDDILSSSPVPNVRTDELGDLMDECEAHTNQKDQNTPFSADILSSPLPNTESQ